MLVKTYCAAVNGLDVTTVTIEVSLTKGVMFRMTGLGDTDMRFCDGFDLGAIDVLFLCSAHGESRKWLPTPT